MLKKVFGEFRYILILFLAAILFLALVALISNWRLILATGPGFLDDLVLSLPYVFGWAYFSYLILAAILFGVNIALAVFYLKQSGRVQATSLGGLIIALLGLGCASCGSLILTPILGAAAGGFLASLPLDGGEFAIFGLAILAWSLYTLVKKIDKPYGD